jgi:hypothetical protein
VIGVVHSHTNFNQPAAGITFDDIKTLEARDGSGNPLTPVSREGIADCKSRRGWIRSGYRRGFGRRGTAIGLCGLN